MKTEGGVCRVLLADDHVLIRHGIKNIISKDQSLAVMGEVGDGEELLAFLQVNSPDLLILDISMPKISGLELVEQIKNDQPEIKILMLTMHKNIEYFYQSMSQGADGYLMKDDSDEELLLAIKKIRGGKTYISPKLADDFTSDVTSTKVGRNSVFDTLTKREYEILELVVAGYTSRDMAEKLCLSPRTVDHHRSSLLRKFKLKSSVDLVSFAVRNGFALPDQEKN